MPVLDKIRSPIAFRGAEPPAPAVVKPGDARTFDPDWYLDTYPDVAMAGLDPVRHYLTHGVRDQRNPNRSFDTMFYLADNPDVQQAGIQPFLHFILYGHREGRRPNALTPKPTRALLAVRDPAN